MIKTKHEALELARSAYYRVRDGGGLREDVITARDAYEQARDAVECSRCDA